MSVRLLYVLELWKGVNAGILEFSREKEPTGERKIEIREKGAYYKKLALVIIEAGKSEELQLETQREPVCGFHPIWKAWESEEPKVYFESKIQQAQGPRRTDVSIGVWRQEKCESPLKSNQTERIVFTQSFVLRDLQLIGWVTLEWASCFSLPIPLLNSSRQALIGTSSIMFDHIFGQSVAWRNWYIKLTITVRTINLRAASMETVCKPWAGWGHLSKLYTLRKQRA